MLAALGITEVIVTALIVLLMVGSVAIVLLALKLGNRSEP